MAVTHYSTIMIAFAIRIQITIMNCTRPNQHHIYVQNSKSTVFAMVKRAWKMGEEVSSVLSQFTAQTLDNLIISKHTHCRVYSHLEDCSITSIS